MLDAKNIAAGVCRIALPSRVPYGAHALWTPARDEARTTAVGPAAAAAAAASRMPTERRAARAIAAGAADVRRRGRRAGRAGGRRRHGRASRRFRSVRQRLAPLARCGRRGRVRVRARAGREVHRVAPPGRKARRARRARSWPAASSTATFSRRSPRTRTRTKGPPRPSRPPLRRHARRPSRALRLFEREGCGGSKRVREALCMLDLACEMRPCPLGATRHRKLLAAERARLAADGDGGGDAGASPVSNEPDETLPFLTDASTGVAERRGRHRGVPRAIGVPDGAAPTPWWRPALWRRRARRARFGAARAAARTRSGLARTSPARDPRGTAGAFYARPSVAVAKPLQLWAYEASPFCALARETPARWRFPRLAAVRARVSEAHGAAEARPGRSRCRTWRIRTRASPCSRAQRSWRTCARATRRRRRKRARSGDDVLSTLCYCYNVFVSLFCDASRSLPSSATYVRETPRRRCAARGRRDAGRTVEMASTSAPALATKVRARVRADPALDA